MDDYEEQKQEAERAAETALQDGVVDSEERDDVEKKVDDARSAYGEAAKKKGDLVETELE